MALQQAMTFYDRLTEDTVLYTEYLQRCSSLGADGDRQWHESEILAFAAEQDYQFSLGDLYQVWFEGEDYLAATVMVPSLQAIGLELVRPEEPDLAPASAA